MSIAHFKAKCILYAFTIPEVITLVLTSYLSVDRGGRGFRMFPQFDDVATLPFK